MTGDSFASRVRGLRREWTERRQVRRLSLDHNFESQYRLFQTLHLWARQAAVEIQREYSGRLSVKVSPLPAVSERERSFSVVIDDAYSLTFRLEQRGGQSPWRIVATMSTSDSVEAVSPRRAAAHWTRSRVEELLLALLGAYERALSEDPSDVPPSRAVRRRLLGQRHVPGPPAR